MLVLSRKSGQRVLIGDSVYVTVLGITGDKVKLGIAAPREVPVLREELISTAGRGPCWAAAPVGWSNTADASLAEPACIPIR